jgi:enoyl-CoA hydratase
MNVLSQWDWPVNEAMQREWQTGRACLADALAGAARFAEGAGRHGKF